MERLLLGQVSSQGDGNILELEVSDVETDVTRKKGLIPPELSRASSPES